MPRRPPHPPQYYLDNYFSTSPARETVLVGKAVHYLVPVSSADDVQHVASPLVSEAPPPPLLQVACFQAHLPSDLLSVALSEGYSPRVLWLLLIVDSSGVRALPFEPPFAWIVLSQSWTTNSPRCLNLKYP